MFEFQGKFKKIFNKDHPSDKPHQASSDPQIPESSKPPIEELSPLSNDLVSAHKEALDHLQEFKQRIEQERTEWLRRMKIRDEERIGIEAQLDQLEKNAIREKERRDLELEKVKTSAHAEIEHLEQYILRMEEEWAHREAQKKRSLEDLEHTKLLEDAHVKVIEDEKSRQQQEDIRTLTETLKRLHDTSNGERTQWIEQVRKKDEDNITLKTKLSLRESQLKADWIERDQQMKKEMEIHKQRVSELEENLGKARHDFERTAQERDEHIRALYSAIEKKKSDSKNTLEMQETSFQKESSRLKEKISILQKQMIDEREAWARIIRERGEECNAIKMQQMLLEAQEKADWDKRKQELAEYSRECDRRIKQLLRSMEEEKELHQQKISQKEQDIESLKIQSTLQIQEIEQGRQHKHESLVSQKENLKTEVQQLEQKIIDEKHFWENQLNLKNSEFDQFKHEIQKRSEQEKNARAENIILLNNEKEQLQKQINQIEEDMRSLKQSHAIQRAEKERVYTQVKENLENTLAQLDSEIKVLDTDLKQINAPLLEDIERLKKTLKNEQTLREEKLKEKETWLEHNKQDLIEHIQHVRDGMSEEKKNIENDKKQQEEHLKKLTQQYAEQEHSFTQEIKKLEMNIEQVSQQLSACKENQKSEKEVLTKKYESELKHLESSIPELKKQIEIQSQKYTDMLRDQEARHAELLLHLQNQKKQREDEVRSLTDEGEHTRAQREKACRDIEDRIVFMRNEAEKKKSELLDALNNLTTEKTHLEEEIKHECSRYATIHENHCLPFIIQKQELEKMMSIEKEKWAGRVADINQQCVELKEKIKDLDRVFDDKKKEQEERYAKMNDEYAETIARKEEEYQKVIQESERDKQSTLAEIETLKGIIAGRQKDYQERLQHLQNETKEVLQQLKQDVELRMQALAMLKKEWPDIAAHKDAELEHLKQHIKEKENTIQQEEQHMVDQVGLVRRSRDERIQELQSQIEKRTLERIEIARQKEEEIARVKKEADEKIKMLDETIQQEGKHFTEEKFVLQKEIEELQWKIGDHEEVTAKQLETKNAEMQKLRTMVNEKDIRWHERLKQLQEQYAHEKNTAQEELDRVDAKLKNTLQDLHNAVRQKEQEINALSHMHDERINGLTQTLRSKQQSWNDIIQKLNQERDHCTAYWEKRNIEWDALVKTRDEERAHLRSQVVQWEEEFHKQEEIEIQKFHAEITTLRQKLDEKEKEYQQAIEEERQKLSEKNTALMSMKRRFQEAEDAVQRTINDHEKQHAEMRDTIQQTIEQLHARIADAENQAQQELKVIEKQIAELMLEKSNRQMESNVIVKKNEREHTKARQELVEKLNELNRRRELFQQDMVLKLRLKDEELAQLQKRLSIRQERLNAEWEHRKQTLSDIQKRLELEIVKLEDSLKLKKHEEEVITERKKILNELNAEIACFPESHEYVLRQQQESLSHSAEKLNKQIQEAQEALQDEDESLNDALRKKQIESELLNKEVSRSDSRITNEINISQNILKFAMDKAIELKDVFTKKFSSSSPVDTRKPKANALYQQGVYYYQQGQYEKALVEFSKAIEYDGKLWTAYQYQGLCYERLEMIDDALVCAEHALTIKPNNPELKEWVKQLKEMR